MLVKLSHPINANDPGWPGNPTLKYEPFTSIIDGDVANTYKLELFNHFGTHFDAPNHFYDPGLKIAQLPPENFIYEHPLLLKIPLAYEQILMPSDLIPYYDQIQKADFLMIYSGLKSERKGNPNAYKNQGPAFGAEAAKYIMDHFNLKALAVDWISLASFLYPEQGKLAHQYLFGAFHNHYTCVIEDANFEDIIDRHVKRVYALPLLIDGVDSGPVTIIAECDA